MRILLLILLLCRPAAAADTDARRHFEEGSKAFALGEFPKAIEEYRAAYRLKPDPAILYNIAQAYRLNSELTQAVFFYRSYLRNMVNAPNRKEVEQRIAALDVQI